MEKEKDYIFQCRKCMHNLYVSIDKLDGLWEYECPNCGEEADELWILIGKGLLEERYNNQ
jgi:transcription elongation factor Elf1